MLRKARELEGFELRAHDGRIGHVTDFFFDDRRWAVRYLVVNTGTWLDHREVLIAPAAVHRPEWTDRVLPVDLTMDQVLHSPAVDAQEPVSRADELALARYYDWPMYWGAPGFSDGLMYALPPILPMPIGPGGAPHSAAAPAALDPQHHLRSVGDVRGHRLEANDGEIGHVDDFLLDDASWVIGFLVIDTRNWWPGKRVLVAPASIFEVGWDEARVFVDLSREQIKRRPAFDPAAPLAGEYIDQLHVHHRPERRNEEP
jgi:uncharacterized protein YrrD